MLVAAAAGQQAQVAMLCLERLISLGGCLLTLSTYCASASCLLRKCGLLLVI